MTTFVLAQGDLCLAILIYAHKDIGLEQSGENCTYVFCLSQGEDLRGKVALIGLRVV